MNDPIKIIGLDPGLRKFGYSFLEYNPNHMQEKTKPLIIRDAGILITDSKLELEERLEQIRIFFKNYIKEKNIKLVFVESVFFSNNRKTCIRIAYAIGAILSFFKELSLEHHFYTPTEVKKTINSSGTAKKDESLISLEKYVAGMQEIFLNKSFNKIKDAVDATAVATTGFIKNILPLQQLDLMVTKEEKEEAKILLKS